MPRRSLRFAGGGPGRSRRSELLDSAAGRTDSAAGLDSGGARRATKPEIARPSRRSCRSVGGSRCSRRHSSPRPTVLALCRAAIGGAPRAEAQGTGGPAHFKPTVRHSCSRPSAGSLALPSTDDRSLSGRPNGAPLPGREAPGGKRWSLAEYCDSESEAETEILSEGGTSWRRVRDEGCEGGGWQGPRRRMEPRRRSAQQAAERAHAPESGTKSISLDLEDEKAVRSFIWAFPREGGARVRKIESRHAPEGHGVMVGDRLLRINGRDVDGLSRGDVRAIWKDAQEDACYLDLDFAA